MKRLMTSILATSVATLGLGALAVLPASASTLHTMHSDRDDAVVVANVSLEDLLHLNVGLLGDDDSDSRQSDNDGKDSKDSKDEHHNGACSVTLPGTPDGNNDANFAGSVGSCFISSGGGGANFPTFPTA